MAGDKDREDHCCMGACRKPVNTSSRSFFNKTLSTLEPSEVHDMLSSFWSGFALVGALIITVSYETVDVWDTPQAIPFEDTVWAWSPHNTTEELNELMQYAQSFHDVAYSMTFGISLTVVLTCLIGIELTGEVPKRKLPAVLDLLGPVWVLLPGTLMGVVGTTYSVAMIIKWSCCQTVTFFWINTALFSACMAGIFGGWVTKLGFVINDVTDMSDEQLQATAMEAK